MTKDNWREVFLKTYSQKNEWHPDASPLDVAAFIEQTRKDAVCEALEEVGKKAELRYDNLSYTLGTYENGLYTGAAEIQTIIRRHRESL